jgi:membrane protein YqaA with SNARE-associated domain
MTEPAAQQETLAAPPPRNPLKRLYHWVLHWADTRYGSWALFTIAFAESSFFPVPPDVLLLPLCLGQKRKAFRFALVCTVGSVLGALLGYLIGWGLREPVAEPLIHFLGLDAEFTRVQCMYHEYAGLAVAAAALTPLPYKLFTIGAGVCGINLVVFVVASVLFRGLRFFAEAAFLWKFGGRIRTLIEKYFWVATTLFFLLLVGGFLLVRHLAGAPRDNLPAGPSRQVEQSND